VIGITSTYYELFLIIKLIVVLVMMFQCENKKEKKKICK